MLTRRDWFKHTAGALVGATGLSRAVAAQVTGTTPGGGAVPLRLPSGALDYLDRNQYIRNFEIVSHISGATAGSDVWPMWAKGSRRVLFGGAGAVDVTDPRKPVVIKGPEGTGGCLNYNTTLKRWIMLSSAGPPITPPNPKYPRGAYDKAYAATSTEFKGLRGIRMWDATNPEKIQLLSEFSTGPTGGGTHANFYDGGKYAYLDAGWDDQIRLESTERPYGNGLMIVDVSDPSRVREVAKWWVKGMRYGEEAEYRKWPFAGDQSSWTSNHGGAYVPTRVEDGGTIAYTGFGAFGFHVLDLTDITKPKVLGRVSHILEGLGGIPYHTCWPVVADAGHPRLQNLIVGVFESLESDCREPFHTSHIIDVTNPRRPKIIGDFPRPLPPKEAPYADYCFARGRFSSHNPQSWIAPGPMKPHLIALTYFSAGLRLFDISNPAGPKEVGYFCPPLAGELDDFESWRRGTGEGIFIEYDRNLIWVNVHEGEKGLRGGLYCLSSPLLGKPVLTPKKVAQWTLPHHNAGWDDQTPKTVYFGRGVSDLA